MNETNGTLIIPSDIPVAAGGEIDLLSGAVEVVKNLMNWYISLWATNTFVALIITMVVAVGFYILSHIISTWTAIALSKIALIVAIAVGIAIFIALNITFDISGTFSQIATQFADSLPNYLNGTVPNATNIT